MEKLPAWFKAQWSDKVLKLQRKKGNDAFPSFEEFAEEVRYHTERTNIPQILRNPRTNGAMTADRGMFVGRNAQRHRNLNVALTSASLQTIILN